MNSLLAVLMMAGQTSELGISLKQAEEEAVGKSPRIAAAGAERTAAEERSRSYFGVILPRLSVEGSWRYSDPIPEMAFGPGPAQPFGDHYGRSLDGVLSWTLWDNSAGYRIWKGARASIRERSAAERLAQNQVLLSVRGAYAQVQLGLEQVRLLGEGLGVAQSQYRDIQNRLKVGASSRLDALSAHQVVLSRTHQLQDARLLLASALRDLLQLMARPEDHDLSCVLPAGGTVPPDSGEPSLGLSLDPLDQDLKSLDRSGPAKPDLKHPSIVALRENRTMRMETATGLRYARGPRLVAGGRLGRDYPNGPVLETVDLKAASLALTFPLFEGGRTLHDAREQDDLARASGARADATAAQVVTEWRKARDNLEGRRKIRDLDVQAREETAELARLVYEAYKTGRTGFLEVENANLRALEAQVQAARTGAQMFLDAAQLDYYSEGDEQ